MSRFLTLLLGLSGALGLCFTSGSAVAQSSRASTNLVYTVAEEEPEFPGGKAALGRYLAEQIRFPNSLTRKNYETGSVSAKFIIDKDGSIRDIRVTTKPVDKTKLVDKKVQKGMQEFMANIIAAIEKMPRWRPGQVAGQSVAVFYTLPIEVTMQ